MRISRTLATALAAGLLSTACGGSDGATGDATGSGSGSGSGSASAPSEDAASSGDAAAEPVSLTLITHDSFSLSDGTLEAFTDETGIEVQLLPSGDAGTMLNQTILTADSPRGDVVFGVDNTFLSRALDEELFQPYESPELAAVPDELELDDEHRVTPIDFGDVCLNYDVAYFADRDIDPPASLADLTDPAYADLLVVENPATSSPGLAFLLATVEEFGTDGWTDYWQQLVDNGVLVSDGWEAAYYGEFSGGAGEGDRPLVVSYASSPPAEVIFADPRPETAPTAVIPASCFRQIEFAGILATTEHPEAAQQLVDFMLSPTFQADVPLNMFVFPAREDVELPPEFVEFSVVPDDPYQLSPSEIGANREAWVEEWTDTVLR